VATVPECQIFSPFVNNPDVRDEDDSSTLAEHSSGEPGTSGTPVASGSPRGSATLGLRPMLPQTGAMIGLSALAGIATSRLRVSCCSEKEKVSNPKFFRSGIQ